jgi:hypothetical protein
MKKSIKGSPIIKATSKRVKRHIPEANKPLFIILECIEGFTLGKYVTIVCGHPK